MNAKQISKDIMSALNQSFWITWNENVKDFPDTEDADNMRYEICVGGILVIISEWLLGFDVENREEILNDFIIKIMNVEEALRDYEKEMEE